MAVYLAPRENIILLAERMSELKDYLFVLRPNSHQNIFWRFSPSITIELLKGKSCHDIMKLIEVWSEDKD